MKKICILQNGLKRGGTDTFVVNLVKGLDKKRYDITVVNPTENTGINWVREPEIIETGAKIYHPIPIVKNRLRYFWDLFKYLKREKFDVLQTNIDLFNGPNLFVAWLAGVPVRCCHSHNTRQQKQIVKGWKFIIKAYQYFMRSMCWTFANRHCGCSEEAMEFLFRGKNWRKGTYPHIINNGINLSLFSQPIDPVRKRKELGLTAKYHVITVGHLIPQKNPLFTAEVFADLCKVRNDCDLIWVGNGSQKDKVQKILDSEGLTHRVHFFDNRNDVAEIMKCADCFILPSVFEGLGIVAIEAQASGLPCLVSTEVPEAANCGAVEFLPINNGTAVWVKAIDEILKGEKKLIVDKKKLREFSIENMVSQMDKVFNS